MHEYDFLSRLEKVRRTGKGRWQACCPVHNDKNPSMSIKARPQGGFNITCYSCGANGLDVFRAIDGNLDELFGKPLDKRDYCGVSRDRYEHARHFIAIYESDKSMGASIKSSDTSKYNQAQRDVKAFEDHAK